LFFGFIGCTQLAAWIADVELPRMLSESPCPWGRKITPFKNFTFLDEVF